MANSPQARKRARQNEVRRLHNGPQKARMRSSVREVLKQVKENNVEGAREAYQRATSLIDKAVHQGHHHKNRAARLKSRLNTRIRNISAG